MRSTATLALQALRRRLTTAATGRRRVWLVAVAVLASSTAATSASTAAGSSSAAIVIAPKVAFSYTGREQSYTVPRGVVLLGVAVEGGHGGQYGGMQGGQGGGNGAGVGALLPVKPGQKLLVEVGSAGVYGGGPVFGGGGAAGAPPPVLCRCTPALASSGGGATDVRTGSGVQTRLIVGGGGGGEGGIGNGPIVTCPVSGGGANSSSFQYPPGNPGLGPLPIVTAAGTVYPGFPTEDGGKPGTGITPAGGGGATAGSGGRQAGCTAGGNGSISLFDSIAGSNAVGPSGGTGGNASTLGPMYAVCSVPAGTCVDAGPGGGGGGGYFGGGGGATGIDRASGNCGTCNTAGSGQGGGAGSSFVSRKMADPVNESSFLPGWDGQAVMVPIIEIDAPFNGAVYKRGRLVHARWECGYDSHTTLGIGGCKGTVPSGGKLSTTPGRHRFTVSGQVSSNGTHIVSATITYTVR